MSKIVSVSKDRGQKISDDLLSPGFRDASTEARARWLHRAWRFRSLLRKELSLVTNRSYRAIGGGERDRTDDLLLAKQALSQLSYTP